MIDFSVYFKKIKNNHYLYERNRILGKGYYVNYKEKKAITEILNNFMINIIKTTSIFTPVTFIISKVFILIYILVGIFVYFNYKNKIQVILGARPEINYPREPLFNIYKKMVPDMDWKKIRFHISTLMVLLLTVVYLFYDSFYKRNKISLIFGFIFLISLPIYSYIVGIFIYYKIKLRKNKKT